jgi:hypothetical protein
MKKLLLLFSLLFNFSVSFSQTCTNDTCETGEDMWNCPRDCWLDTIVKILPGGGRVDWLKNGNNFIAFDREGTDGFFDVYKMKPDTSALQCLTCGHPSLPTKHIGQPAWHPSGNWIVFQAEKQTHPGFSTFATPGRGVHNDLWLMSPDASTVCQLTNVPNDGEHGVLHPHFSHDGTKLAWSQMTHGAVFQVGKEVGSWELHVADFNGCGALTNEMIFQPGDSVFYENHYFSPDDSCIIFTSNMLVGNAILTKCNIYRLNIYTNQLTQLTGIKYNEHASYTPDGSKILWGTTNGNTAVNPGMDFWMMNPDSTNKQRLTFFNLTGHYESESYKVATVDHSWNTTGDSLVFLRGFNGNDTGSIWMLVFNGPLTGIEEEMDINMHVYPNPFYDQLNIDFENPMNEMFTGELYNSMGQLVQSVQNNAEKIILQRNGLKTGMYFLRLRNGFRWTKSAKIQIE